MPRNVAFFSIQNRYILYHRDRNIIYPILVSVAQIFPFRAVHEYYA